MTSSDGWKAGNGNTFLFKYTNTNQFHKLKCKDKSGEAYHYPNHLSTFGYGHSLTIANDCNVNTSSFSNLGSTY